MAAAGARARAKQLRTHLDGGPRQREHVLGGQAGRVTDLAHQVRPGRGGGGLESEAVNGRHAVGVHGILNHSEAPSRAIAFGETEVGAEVVRALGMLHRDGVAVKPKGLEREVAG